jgi:hypothetical protein
MVLVIVKSGILGVGGEGVREVLIELLRSWQLSRNKREEKLNGGGGGGLLAWPTTAASLQITMEIHISNWTHKFQKKTGLDAKANSELYKSNRVCSAHILASTSVLFTLTTVQVLNLALTHKKRITV